MGLNPIKYRQLIAKLKQFGLKGPFPGGKHPYFLLANKLKVTIPNFHNKDVATPILKVIIKKLGITEDEFINL